MGIGNLAPVPRGTRLCHWFATVRNPEPERIASPSPRDERTSGLKEKRLPPDDLQKLLDYLLDEAKRRPRQSSNGISTRGMATLLLLCGTITGLRHCEWVSVVVTPCPPG